MTTLLLVAEWALRSSILIATGALVLWAFRVKSASTRLAVWVVILCASLAIPVLSVFTPGLSLPAPRVSFGTPHAVTPAAAPPVTIAVAPASSAAALPIARTETKSWLRSNAARLAVTGYVLIAATLLLRLCVGLMLGLRVLRASRPTGRTVQGVAVRETERVSVPVTLGIMRPAIVLPSDWREWEPTTLAAVLAHERSHVARMDPLIQAGSAIHRALLWFTPLSWFLHASIVRVAEEASDDAALSICDRASYANILLGFMRTGLSRVAWQGVAMASGGEGRIRRILDRATVSRRVTLGTALGIVALVSPLTYVVAAARPHTPSETTATVPQRISQVDCQPVTAASRPAPVVSSGARRATPARTERASTRTETAFTPQTTTTPPTTTTTQTSPAIRRYLIVRPAPNGDSITGSWDSEDPVDEAHLREKFGNSFAWFRKDGHEYIITDPAVMADLDKAMEPQKNVNEMQAVVNAAQQRVNGLQTKVNAHQNEVNGLQSEVNHRQELVNRLQDAVNHGDNATAIKQLEAELQGYRASKVDVSQAEVNRRQTLVNAEQADVNAEQSKVNARQQEVNAEQHRVSEEFNRQMQQILSSALQRGVAKQLN